MQKAPQRGLNKVRHAKSVGGFKNRKKENHLIQTHQPKGKVAKYQAFKRASGVGQYQKRFAPHDVSIIIPACNESKTLRVILPRLIRWSEVKEVLVIANGCTDDTAAVARHMGAKVTEFAKKLGHDTGRAIGAKYATGEYLLFLDADINWKLKDLQPFTRALRQGADISLNRYPAPTDKTFHHPTAVAKRALNLALNHPEWKASSLTTVPHGIRRSVLLDIDWKSLAIPPLAFARACYAEHQVSRPHYVNVGKLNRYSNRYPRQYTTKDLIIGDHIQAISFLLSAKGARGGFHDGLRKRTVLQESLTSTVDEVCHDTLDTIAVIPVHNERKTLPRVLREVNKLHLSRILVVENGSTDGTQHITDAGNLNVWHYNEPIGHDVGRGVGMKISGCYACTLFVDGDFEIPYRNLTPFLNSINNGTDVALNHLGKGLPLWRRRDAASTMKTFLNIALGQPKLGIGSLTAVPHAFSKKALEVTQPEDLAVPPKAYARASLSGLKIKLVHYVDVIQPNRRRFKQHAGRNRSPMAQLIIGDHLEAMDLLIRKRGDRGGFIQPRKLEVLEKLELA